jgi:mannose-6-phosphate isomerase class I
MSRDDLRRPLPLAYHPLYRFYEGGGLTRQFRGLPERPDDWWSEDWVGSCTCAGNPDPDGRVQGLSTVDLPSGEVTLKSLAEAWPEEMGDASVLVKLLSPSGPVPLHAHPTRAWARRHLGSPFGKTEAWILLDTPGDGTEAAYAGIGFQPGVIVIPETSGEDDPGATMGLGWDLALDMIDYGTADAASTLARARQQPRVLRTSRGSREVRLLAGDVAEFFDATMLEVADEIEVADGRFSIAIVTAGDGWAEGDFGRQPLSKGQTFAWPASLSLRLCAGRAPLRVVRCLGPGGEVTR